MKTWHDVPGAVKLHVDGHTMAWLTWSDARGWTAHWAWDNTYIGCYGDLPTAKREVAAAFDTLSALYT